MTAVAGYQSRVLAGSLNVSCAARSASASVAIDALEVSTLCDGPSKAFIVGGDSGQFSVDGPLDVASSTNEPFDIMAAWKGTTAPITFGVGGLDAGDEAWLLDGVQTAFDTSAAQAGTVDFSISAQATGAVGIGVSCGFETISATGDGDAVDLGAAGTNGAVLHLHVTEFTSLTSDTVVVEHSVDGSTSWETLGSFTAATGLTSQRVTVSGAVRRYVRVSDTFSGSGSIIRGVAVAKL